MLPSPMSQVISHDADYAFPLTASGFSLPILHTKELFHVAGSATKSERIAIGISITKALTVADLGSWCNCGMGHFHG